MIGQAKSRLEKGLIQYGQRPAQEGVAGEVGKAVDNLQVANHVANGKPWYRMIIIEHRVTHNNVVENSKRVVDWLEEMEQVMPKKMHRALEKSANKKGLTGKRRKAYVYGTMAKKKAKKRK